MNFQHFTYQTENNITTQKLKISRLLDNNNDPQQNDTKKPNETYNQNTQNTQNTQNNSNTNSLTTEGTYEEYCFNRFNAEDMDKYMKDFSNIDQPFRPSLNYYTENRKLKDDRISDIDHISGTLGNIIYENKAKINMDKELMNIANINTSNINHSRENSYYSFGSEYGKKDNKSVINTNKNNNVMDTCNENNNIIKSSNYQPINTDNNDNNNLMVGTRNNFDNNFNFNFNNYDNKICNTTCDFYRGKKINESFLLSNEQNNNYFPKLNSQSVHNSENNTINNTLNNNKIIENNDNFIIQVNQNVNEIKNDQLNTMKSYKFNTESIENKHKIDQNTDINDKVYNTYSGNENKLEKNECTNKINNEINTATDGIKNTNNNDFLTFGQENRRDERIKGLINTNKSNNNDNKLEKINDENDNEGLENSENLNKNNEINTNKIELTFKRKKDFVQNEPVDTNENPQLKYLQNLDNEYSANCGNFGHIENVNMNNSMHSNNSNNSNSSQIYNRKHINNINCNIKPNINSQNLNLNYGLNFYEKGKIKNKDQHENNSNDSKDDKENDGNPFSENLSSQQITEKEFKVSNPFSKQNAYTKGENKPSVSRKNSADHILTGHIKNLKDISYLPQNEQIRLLFKDNQSLQGELGSYKEKYGNLNEDISKKSKLKNYLYQDNEDLKKKCQKYTKVIEYMLETFNNLNNKLKRKKILMDDINNNQKSAFNCILHLQNEIFGHIDSSLKKGGSTSGSDTGSNKSFDDRETVNSASSTNYMENVIARNKEDNGDKYNYYSEERINRCCACKEKIGNSCKGYSPLMCSPNKLLYIKNGDDDIKESDGESNSDSDEESDKSENEDE